MLSDYIILPKDLLRFFYKIYRKFTPWDLLGILVLAITFEIFGWFLATSYESLIFIFIGVAVFYWNVDSLFIIGLAIASILAVAFLLLSESMKIISFGELASSKVAVWSFYLLMIGLFKQVWDLRKTSTTIRKRSDLERPKIIQNVKPKIIKRRLDL